MTGSPEPPPPVGMLEWPSFVLGLLHRRTREIVESGLAEVDLGLREYFALVHIDELTHASQQQVADRSHIDRSDLVRILDRLEKRALITRTRDEVDRRRHVLSLTPAGRATLERATAASDRATRQAFSALSATELESLHALALKALGPNAAGTGDVVAGLT